MIDNRAYRGVMEPEGLDCYRVVIGESDLYICTEGEWKSRARESLAERRRELEEYLESHPSFGMSFKPVPATGDAPGIVEEMARAASVFDVGPMASVAGAIAQRVGRDLLNLSSQVIVENGGDIFMAGGRKRRVRVFAGEGAPAIDIKLACSPGGMGLCTSSATVGPSVSLGAADAVAVLAQTATLADAAASAFGNMVNSTEEIGDVLTGASEHAEVLGIVVVAGGSVGVWGGLEIA
ncbi:MAG: UPF0280 family protein [Actinobacteria bacterium]|nr:UPF0280 family protein [Actinomycetota bacterium]MCG2817677.1 UPF0280 family protein [Actinomycetes bacterium]MBU4219310.1 UPF0280 family protein [Actinomycetota bacterium]MBU4359594.1 UPF0280 family protein [Actinomycetota bacterium]MBU4392157.1 UPF0280 family protein [Actinomycetota bacterium]